MRIRMLVSSALCVCLLGAHPRAQMQIVVVPRGPLGIAPPMEIMRRQASAALSSLQQFGQQLQAANGEIAQARTAYWAAYPDKPGLPAAAEAFQRSLFDKDLFYLSQNYVGESPLLKLPFAQLDRGIAPRAKLLFDIWVSHVRANMVDSAGRFQLTPAALLKALSLSEEAYAAYTVERDWAEFLFAGRDPAWVKTSAQYLAMLYLRDRHLSRADAEQSAKSLVAVFGQASVDAAVKRVRAVRKFTGGRKSEIDGRTLDGLVEDVAFAEELKGLDRVVDDKDPLIARALVPAGRILMDDASPLSAIEALLTDTSPEAYMHGIAYRHLRKERPTTWAAAKEESARLMQTYGVQAFREVAAAIKSAPQTQRGVLADPAALGVPPSDDLYESAVFALDVRTGKRAAAVPSVSAASRAANPIFAAWFNPAAEDSLHGQASSNTFYEFRYEGRTPAVQEYYISSRQQGQDIALSTRPSLTPVQEFRASTAGRTTTAVYPRLGPDVNADGAARFMKSDAWPWAKEPGMEVDAGIETLVVSRHPVECRWWSMAGNGVRKVAWFSDAVPGMLVRLYTIDADGKTSDVMTASAPGPASSARSSVYATLAERFGKAADAPRKTGVGRSVVTESFEVTPLKLPSGMQVHLTLDAGVPDGRGSVNVQASLVDPMIAEETVIFPKGTKFMLTYEDAATVSERHGLRTTSVPVGWFKLAGAMSMPQTYVLYYPSGFELAEVFAGDGPKAWHRRPIAAGTVLTFTTR